MAKSELNVKITELSKNRISVELEVPAERCKSSYESTLARMGSSIKLPGFRPGKIPKQVIIQQIGIARIKAATLESLVDKAWKDAIAQTSIEPTGEAQLKEELQSLVDRFNPNENVIFTLEADIAETENEADA